MCGIVGYVGPKAAAPILLRALHDLEYRGYDSAGIAVLSQRGSGTDSLTVAKRQGKIINLEAALAAGEALSGTTGIGHTRWATHGEPSDRNAHPHASCDGDIVVIHNGIVENYAELRSELRAAGHTFASDTDTETIAHLMEDYLRDGAGLLEALRVTAARLQGSQAIVAMAASEPGVIVAARIGNAGGVVIGHGEGDMVLASYLAAILPHTQHVSFLADGQFARLTAASVGYIDATGETVAVAARTVPIDPVSALKGDYAHFMLKEIMEQPEALSDTIHSLVTLEPAAVHLDDIQVSDERLAQVERVVLIGMGTSLHAAMLGRAYFEAFARIPAETDNASEFRYRNPVLDERTLVISVSQSGETVDVLEAMQVAKLGGALQVTICNTEGAQTTRVADGTVYTRAGLERGVASTKCFTTATVALYAFALRLGQMRGKVTAHEVSQRIAELALLPGLASRTLAASPAYAQLATHFAEAEHMLFLGRGLAFPAAMEGALKMKEISYVHAEGYAAGEMKHGPIALIDRSFPTVAIATKHALRSKMISNIQQVQARSGEVLAVVTEGDSQVSTLADRVITIPETSALLEPIVASLPLQLFAYHAAVHRGCDVDQPRNLAKTVTVE
ncbi:MAG: glutamine--fructose-6-phosphate transaminase (isomerizing) [Tepidiformaceae bacterium]